MPQPPQVLVPLMLRQFQGIFNLLPVRAAAPTFMLRKPSMAGSAFFLSGWTRQLDVLQECQANAAVENALSKQPSDNGVV